MYVVPVEVKKSSIHGKGVFAMGDIQKGKLVWKFTKGHDKKISVQEFDGLDDKEKKAMENTGYLSPNTNLWVFPPKDDPACFTNHSSKNNLSAVFDPKISDEPYFVANKDIERGEELTNNYPEFDKISQRLKPEWLSNT